MSTGAWNYAWLPARVRESCLSVYGAVQQQGRAQTEQTNHRKPSHATTVHLNSTLLLMKSSKWNDPFFVCVLATSFWVTSGPVFLFLLVTCFFFSLYISTLFSVVVVVVSRSRFVAPSWWRLTIEARQRSVWHRTDLNDEQCCACYQFGLVRVFGFGFPLTVQGTSLPCFSWFPNSSDVLLFCFSLQRRVQNIQHCPQRGNTRQILNPYDQCVSTRQLNSREHISATRQESIRFPWHPLYFSPYFDFIF